MKEGNMLRPSSPRGTIGAEIKKWSTGEQEKDKEDTEGEKDKKVNVKSWRVFGQSAVATAVERSKVEAKKNQPGIRGEGNRFNFAGTTVEEDDMRIRHFMN